MLNGNICFQLFSPYKQEKNEDAQTTKLDNPVLFEFSERKTY